MENVDISVVVPVYGCRAALFELHRRISATLEAMGVSFELVLVDDQCPQGSWEDIARICETDHRVKGIRLSRNFGQIRAITAGLDVSRGSWVVVMDCDLQDRPESIKELYETALEGYDVVFARRAKRKDGFITKLLSRSFYKVYDYFTDGNYDASLCNFSISRRVVIDAYCSMREHNRAYTMFIKWLGFKQTAIELEGDERFEGASSYSFSKKNRHGKRTHHCAVSQAAEVCYDGRFCHCFLCIYFSYRNSCEVFLLWPHCGWLHLDYRIHLSYGWIDLGGDRRCGSLCW